MLAGNSKEGIEKDPKDPKMTKYFQSKVIKKIIM